VTEVYLVEAEDSHLRQLLLIISIRSQPLLSRSHLVN
jgi:hypothetical protein